MNEFDKLLENIPVDSIKNYLLSLTTPCFESQLIKIAFNEPNIFNIDAFNLYRYHFALFYLLYKLQDDYYKENKYLHVHFMRIFLTDYPNKGECRFYDEYTGLFCKNKNINNEITYCDFHSKKMGENNLDNLSSKYYYLNKENFFNINKETAEELLNGAWEVIIKYKEYKNCFKILDLPETSDINTIKKRYKYLAKKYHPDCIEKNNPVLIIDKSFNEINNAYRYLIKKLTFKDK